MREILGNSGRRLPARLWPWLVLALTAVTAVWHVLDFPDDVDTEFPRVERLTISRRPPPAYRLAEPGDTLDRVAIYLSASALVLSLAGAWKVRGRPSLWPVSAAVSLAALWHAATPGPTFDGWHGLGWREIFDPKAPVSLRVALALAAAALAGFGVRQLIATRDHWPEFRRIGRERGVSGLLVVAIVFVVLRQGEIPAVEPLGYWPRWAFAIGLIALNLALLRTQVASQSSNRFERFAVGVTGTLGWVGLVFGGIWLTWYHRPLERLHTVVPERIYISAMPTTRGLEIAHRRHHFKTIINLFPEDTPFRSPLLSEEIRFAKQHGIHYVGNPSDADLSISNAFLDSTLKLARDPEAWPILVHCHACMDRSPAWMGIYRFVVEGRPLAEILQEIERHRGYRPKASVTLLYNRVLASRAPARYEADPTAADLRRCAAGTIDPFGSAPETPAPGPNLGSPPRVSRGAVPPDPVPNLTPSPRSLEYLRVPRDQHLHLSATPP